MPFKKAAWSLSGMSNTQPDIQPTKAMPSSEAILTEP